jgi:hypothetical protein
MPNGQRYGPADLPTLAQWASENRVLPTTTILDVSTGATMPASLVPGLTFPTPYRGAPGASHPSQSSPYAGYYSRQPHGQTNMGDKEVTWAWILGALGLLCCPCVFSVGGIALAVVAEQRGHPNARSALIFCVVTLILGTVCGLAFNLMDLF